MNNFKRLLEREVNFASGIVHRFLIGEQDVYKAKKILDSLGYDYSIKRFNKRDEYYVAPLPINKNSISVGLVVKLKDEKASDKMVVKKALKKAKVKIIDSNPNIW